jgi:hypothetical protein
VVSAGSVSVQIGAGDFAVPVGISDVSDLYAFQFDLTFDPDALRLLDITEGPFLQMAGDTVFIGGAIDNVAGTASFTTASALGALPGPSGSGPALQPAASWSERI